MIMTFYSGEGDSVSSPSHTPLDTTISSFPEAQKKKKKKLLFGLGGKLSFKLLLTTTCVCCVLVDLLEELLNEIPYLKKFVGNVGVHHGVMLLTITHVWSHVTDFSEKLEDMDTENKEIEKKNNVENFVQKLYKTEDAAAHAYDLVTLYTVGKSGSLNFPGNLLLDVPSNFQGSYTLYISIIFFVVLFLYGGL